MTPGTENGRGGEGSRSSRRSPRRRTPPPSTNESGATPPTATSAGNPAPPDQPARRRGKRGHGADDTAPPRAPRVPAVSASQDASAETGGKTAEAASAAPAARQRRETRRAPHSNALGALIEVSFADPNTPVHSYSELERRSHISREALSRYVTPRADRRRSPTIETLATIAEAMHLSLEQVCRAAAASSRGIALPSSAEQRVRDEVAAPLLATLTDEQFAAVIELLRQMQPRLQPQA